MLLQVKASSAKHSSVYIEYNVIYSVQYNVQCYVLYILKYIIQFGAGCSVRDNLQEARGRYSSGNKSDQPATLTSEYSLLYSTDHSTVKSAVYSTVYNLVFCTL